MKRRVKLLCALLGVAGGVFAQGNVGINTIGEPQATLDVNGTVRLKEPGDYNPESFYLGRDKTSKKLVHLKPTQTLFAVDSFREPLRLGERLSADTGVKPNEYYVVLINPKLVKKSDGKVPVMQIQTVASDDYARPPRGTVNYDEPRLKDFDGVIYPATASFIGREGGKAYMTTSVRFEGNPVYAQGRFEGGGKNVLFYSPPKFLAANDVAGSRGWTILGGYVNQLPVDRVTEDDREGGVPTMEYRFDILKIPAKLVKEYGIIHLNVTGDQLNQIEVAPQNNQPNPPVR